MSDLNLFGEPITRPAAEPGAQGFQLGLLEVAPTSTFSTPAPAPLPTDTRMF